MRDPTGHVVSDPGEPPEVSRLDQAIEQLQDQICPIDGNPTFQTADFDENEHRFEECRPTGHSWPLKRIGRSDWYPDRDGVEERLEEYRDGALPAAKVYVDHRFVADDNNNCSLVLEHRPDGTHRLCGKPRDEHHSQEWRDGFEAACAEIDATIAHWRPFGVSQVVLDSLSRLVDDIRHGWACAESSHTAPECIARRGRR